MWGNSFDEFWERLRYFLRGDAPGQVPSAPTIEPTPGIRAGGGWLFKEVVRGILLAICVGVLIACAASIYHIYFPFTASPPSP